MRRDWKLKRADMLSLKQINSQVHVDEVESIIGQHEKQ